MKSASVTALRTYLLCPRKYYYAYAEWLPADQAERTKRYALSNILHAALADWHAAGTGDWETLDRALIHRWDSSLFADVMISASEYHRGRWMLWEKFTTLGAVAPLRYEYAFDLDFAGGRFTGRLDRVDECDGGIEVIEYLVGPFNEDRDAWGFQIYGAVASKLLGRPVRTLRVIQFGVTGEDKKLAPADSREVERNVSRLRRAMAGDREFHPKPGRPCLTCAYAQICDVAYIDERRRGHKRPNEMLRLFRAVEELVHCGDTPEAFHRAVESAASQLDEGSRTWWLEGRTVSEELEKTLASGVETEGEVTTTEGDCLSLMSASGLVVPVGRLCVINIPENASRTAAEILGRSLRITAARMESYRAATTDGLTGLFRREVLERRLSLADSCGYSLIICDVDHFKLVNDSYGHDAGDAALRTVGAALSAFAGAIAHRLGGEEFCLYVPTSDTAYAREIAETLRLRLEESVIRYAAGELKITASFGVAAARDSEAGSAVLKRADEALYEAKESGRNRVMVSS